MRMDSSCSSRPRRGSGGSFLDLYLREINRAPLLGPQRERALARRVAAGDPKARDLLIRANLRLVVHLARRFAGRGVPLEDLVAEGNLGLIHAAENFDPERGARFGTYAAYWVRQSIRQQLAETARPVRLPPYLHTLLARWGRAAARLHDELGRQPSEAEVAAVLGLSGRKRARARAALHASAARPEAEGDGAGERPAVEALPDHRAAGPEEALATAEEVGKALVALGEIAPRQAAVLRLRFGLEDGRQRTLQEIGDLLGITREGVRQLEARALAELAGALGAR